MSFELSLTCWQADVPEIIKKIDPATQKEVNVFSGETIQEDYPIRENLQAMLRSPGVFTEVNDVAEAVHLAHMIKDEAEDVITIDKQQVTLLKKCLDAHLAAAAEGKCQFGGPTHEPLILRIAELTKEAKVR